MTTNHLDSLPGISRSLEEPEGSHIIRFHVSINLLHRSCAEEILGCHRQDYCGVTLASEWRGHANRHRCFRVVDLIPHLPGWNALTVYYQVKYRVGVAQLGVEPFQMPFPWNRLCRKRYWSNFGIIRPLPQLPAVFFPDASQAQVATMNGRRDPFRALTIHQFAGAL